MDHKIVGTVGGFLALCSCGEAVDDWGAHVGPDEAPELFALGYRASDPGAGRDRINDAWRERRQAHGR